MRKKTELKKSELRLYILKKSLKNTKICLAMLENHLEKTKKEIREICQENHLD